MNTARPSSDLTRALLAIIFIVLMICASLWIMRPFVPALIWSTLLVVSTWRLMLLVQAKLWGKRSLAVTVMTLGLLLVIVPLALAVSTLMENAELLAVKAQAIQEWSVPPPPAWAERVPIVGSRLAKRWQELSALAPEELRAHLEPYSKDVRNWILQTAGNLAMFFLHLVLTVILSAVFYAKGEVAIAGVRAFARRLAGPRGEQMTTLAGQAIQAVALGVVVTAFVQLVLGGIGLAFAGVPFATVLTALMFILAIAQIGAGPVLIVAIIWLYWSGETTTATIFLVWSIFVGTIDNVLRPLLIKLGADLPLLLIFAGVIGGLLGFGVVGLFIGPMMLAVVYTLLVEWVKEGKDAYSAPQS